jgi:hypothetical protein
LVESSCRQQSCLARFAVRQSADPVVLELRLHADPPAAPALTLKASAPCRLRPLISLGGGEFRVVLEFDPAADPECEDEVTAELSDPAGVSPACRVVLRRSTCILSTGLLEQESLTEGARRRWPQTEAALRWYGWGRFRELVGIKRFTSGRSGKDVFVFRPRLRAPADDNPHLATSHPADALEGTWGTWLLVKSGTYRDVAKEWDRFQTFLKDRLHPFLARTEEMLVVRSSGDAVGGFETGGPAATLVSSFLGGDLIHTETLEDVVCGAADFEGCGPELDRTLDLLAPWHRAARPFPLGRWRRVYNPKPEMAAGGGGAPGEAEWLLFGKFDFSRKETIDKRHGIEDFAAGLMWDIDFVRKDHLLGHVLGEPSPDGPDPDKYGLPGPRRDGLLPALMGLRTPFGLTHGDLNPRNVLCQGNNAWLIDFEHTGVAPATADYARLEANLRLWCLTLAHCGDDVAGVAEQFERCLLDNFHGSEGGLVRVRALAHGLGADADELLKIARCIARVRSRAAPHCSADYADRRDYLAVLYLTVLSLLQYDSEEDAAPPANFRLLVGTARVLEDALCRLLGRAPFGRRRSPLKPEELVSRDWLAPEGAPGRVRYLLDRPDGRLALPPLAACRGVIQNDHHHLDVFDHTLLVLAYVEALLADPVGGLMDPAALDARVAADLAGQNVGLPPIPAPSRASPATPPSRPPGLEAYLNDVLDDESRLLLKWLALLHDVGKPGTRGSGLHDVGKPGPRGSGEGRVQFIGHEVYGRQLVSGLLLHLYPEDGPRHRLSQLIVSHHRFHHIVTHFAEHDDDFKRLQRLVSKENTPLREFSFLSKRVDPTLSKRVDPTAPYEPDFALLLLHGYADRLAGRGQPVDHAIEVARAVMTFCAGYAAGAAESSLDRKLFQDLSRYLDARYESHPAWRQVRGRAMGEVRAWYTKEQDLRRRQKQPPVTLEELIEYAEAIIRRDFPELLG